PRSWPGCAPQSQARPRTASADSPACARGRSSMLLWPCVLSLLQAFDVVEFLEDPGLDQVLVLGRQRRQADRLVAARLEVLADRVLRHHDLRGLGESRR